MDVICVSLEMHHTLRDEVDVLSLANPTRLLTGGVCLQLQSMHVLLYMIPHLVGSIPDLRPSFMVRPGIGVAERTLEFVKLSCNIPSYGDHDGERGRRGYQPYILWLRLRRLGDVRNLLLLQMPPFVSSPALGLFPALKPYPEIYAGILPFKDQILAQVRCSLAD